MTFDTMQHIVHLRPCCSRMRARATEQMPPNTITTSQLHGAWKEETETESYPTRSANVKQSWYRTGQLASEYNTAVETWRAPLLKEFGGDYPPSNELGWSIKPSIPTLPRSSRGWRAGSKEWYDCSSGLLDAGGCWGSIGGRWKPGIPCCLAVVVSGVDSILGIWYGPCEVGYSGRLGDGTS